MVEGQAVEVLVALAPSRYVENDEIRWSLNLRYDFRYKNVLFIVSRQKCSKPKDNKNSLYLSYYSFIYTHIDPKFKNYTYL